VPENTQTVETVSVKDEGSPSGPRENVPARLNGKGVEIQGEDGKWYKVEPVDKGQNIILEVLGKIRARYLQG